MTRAAIAKRIQDRARQVLVRAGRHWPHVRRLVPVAEIVAAVGDCPGDPRDYDLDHVEPVARFDLAYDDQVRAAFHPSNFRWLRAGRNRSDGAR